MAPSLRAAAASSSSTGGPADLVPWVESMGGKVQGIISVVNLAGRDGGSGWGLKASQDCSPGAKLIDLPEACHLTYSETEADARLLALIRKVPDDLWGAKLALQVLAHRLLGADSPYATYIAALPVGVPGIPMFFSREALSAIDYPPVSEQVRRRCRWLFDFSKDVLAPLPGTPADPFLHSRVDINALGWGLAVVTSRAFRVKGPSKPAAMLPLIDMCNHSFDPNVEVQPTERGMGLFAKRKLMAGEPLLLSYGALPNDFLFMDYGFVVPDNPHDFVQLRFDVDFMQAAAEVGNATNAIGGKLSLGLSPWRQQLLTQLGLLEGGSVPFVALGGVQHVDARLVAAARIFATPDLAEIKARPLERLGDLDRPLSNTDAEVAALRTLSGVCALSLSAFHSDIETDAQLLAAPVAAAAAAGSQPAEQETLSDDVQLAVRFRLEKKKIVRNAMVEIGRRLAAALGKPAAPQQRSGGDRPAGATGGAGGGKGRGFGTAAKNRGSQGFGTPKAGAKQ